MHCSIWDRRIKDKSFPKETKISIATYQFELKKNLHKIKSINSKAVWPLVSLQGNLKKAHTLICLYTFKRINIRSSPRRQTPIRRCSPGALGIQTQEMLCFWKKKKTLPLSEQRTISTRIGLKISNGRLSKMAFRSFTYGFEGLIRELLDDEPRDVPFKVSGIRLSKKKPRGIKWRCSLSLSPSRSPSCIFQS